MPGVSPLIALRGHARDAVDFYERTIGATCLSQTLYGPGEEGAEGTVRLAVLGLGQSTFRIIDVPDLPDFVPSAALSVLLACDGPADVNRYARALADRGEVMMPADAYPFADRFAWVADRFGVHWQLIHVGNAAYPGAHPA